MKTSLVSNLDVWEDGCKVPILEKARGARRIIPPNGMTPLAREMAATQQGAYCHMPHDGYAKRILGTVLGGRHTMMS